MARAGSWCFVVWVLSGVLSPAAGQEAERSVFTDPEVEQPAQPPPGYVSTTEWHWRQIINLPKGAGRVSRMAVDYNADPVRIFLGTEEGRVVRSLDGGVTWQEIPLSPWAPEKRNLWGGPPKPKAHLALSDTLRVPIDPPYSYAPGARVDVPLPFSDLFTLGPPTATRARSIRGIRAFQTRRYVRVNIFPRTPGLAVRLLQDAVRDYWEDDEPVNGVAICKGGNVPLLVSTTAAVYGSWDEGDTYTPLFRSFGGSGASMGHGGRVRRVKCSPWDPNYVIVGTDSGYWISHDGGLSYSVVPISRPAFKDYNVGREYQFAPPKEDGTKPIIAAIGPQFYVGDPESPQGMILRYPETGLIETGPRESIECTAVCTAGDGSYFIGTEDGLRRSRDEGKTWDAVARSLFDRRIFDMVACVPNERGENRIYVLVRNCEYGQTHCIGSLLYASDDDGENFEVVFESNRKIPPFNYAAGPSPAPPRLWLAAGPQFWTTVYRTADEKERSPYLSQYAAWARARLRVTPPLDEVLHDAERNAYISTERLDSMFRANRERRYFPIVEGRLAVVNDETITRTLQGPTALREINSRQSSIGYGFFVQLKWEFIKVFFDSLEVGGNRESLYTLREQFRELIEESWSERVLHLRRLAAGDEDGVLEGEILKERVVVLEALMERLIGYPFKTPHPRAPRAVERQG